MQDTDRKPSLTELIFGDVRIVLLLVLGSIAIVTLFTQEDPVMIRYVLGGVATLGFLGFLFAPDRR